jgi:hypothetical protein
MRETHNKDDLYVTQIIFEEAKRVTNVMTKGLPVPDEKILPTIAVERRD